MTTNNQTIGFIGLGLMGSAMVECLQDNGFKMVVLANRSRQAVDAAVARGAQEVSSARAVAEKSDIIMLCMDTSQSVEARMRGEQGVIAGLSDGKIVIDFGTSLPASTRPLALEVAQKGAAMLDGPLGRTPQHAKQGLLNIMTAGDKDAFARAKPVLDVVGENVFYLGESGAGHVMKLLNNAMSMTGASMMAEIFAVADKAGVSRQDVYDVMSSGPNHSMMMDMVSAYALRDDDTQLAFAIKNGAKDAGYYQQMLADAGIERSIASQTASEMTQATNDGLGDEMVPKMIDHFLKAYK